MTTETFAGGHGAPSTIAFYAPDQKRNVLGEFDKEDGSGQDTDWEKAKGMSVEQWDKLSDKERASLLAAVYVADADKKPGASAALAKLRGWVAGGKDRKKAGGAAKGAADKKNREAEAAKKKAAADKARAERARNARRVRPDTVNSSHADGYIIGESENKNTRMRWDKENSTYVIEKKDGGKWKESRRLKPNQAYDELAKPNSNWFRPTVQPYLKPPAKKTPAAKTPAKTPAATPPPATKGPGINEGHVDKPDQVSTDKPEPNLRKRKKAQMTKSLIAAAEVHTGAMIALIPREDLTASLAVDGGEDAEQLHMTEVYLGQAADISEDEQFRIIDALSDFASRQYPVEGDAFSVNLFNPPGTTSDDGKDRDSCVTLGISGHDVAAFHDELVDTLERAGIEYPEQHAPRVPHITLVYTDDADLSYFTDKTGPIVFDTLRLAFGGEVFDIPLGEGRDDDDLTAGGVANFKFDPRQPRDGEGQWTDGPSDRISDVISDFSPTSPNTARSDRKKLSDAQQNELRRYTSATFDLVNSALRYDEDTAYDENTGDEWPIEESTEPLDSAMYEIPRNMQTYRRTTIDSFGVSDFAELQDIVGQEFTDKAYVSTSLKPDAPVAGSNTSANVRMIIDVPRGSRGVYVGEISEHPEEDEFLLARNTRFEITDVSHTSDGATVRMKVI